MRFLIIKDRINEPIFRYSELRKPELRLIRKAINDRIDLLTDSQTDVLSKEKEAEKLENILKKLKGD